MGINTTLVPCNPGQDGVLTPALEGIVVVKVIKNKGSDGLVSGRVEWSGRTQGFITYDDTGTIVIGLTVTDLSPNAYLTEKSLRNILLGI